MQLDIQTLAVVTVFVTALLGALLVFAGLQNRDVRAPMMWGSSYIVSAVGLALLTTHGSSPDFIAIDIANALVLLGFGLTWAGARMFDQRPVRPMLVLAAPVLWLVACRIPAFTQDINLGVVLLSAMLAMLAAVTAEEFWTGRDEPLMSRWPTVVVLLAYGAALLARIPATLLSPSLEGQTLMHGVSFAVIAFGTLLFTVVMAFLLLNMTKERTELQHKIASLIDPLSGVPNRRAFLEGSARLLKQQADDNEPLAIFLFDLDRFKMINDQLGHGVGDKVLQLFADTATATLGRDILFGRIGGEEFAAVFPVGDFGEATAIADRVRRNFAVAAAPHGSMDLTPTVSVGVTIGRDPKVEIKSLLALADQALYRAKANGRNRVETTASGATAVAQEMPVIDIDMRRAWRTAAARV
ncbi:MAG: GGDEF domain-containing protein [Hyphomicrobiales bacterium]